MLQSSYRWGVVFGWSLFRNLKMMGSTANVVAIGMIERQKIGHLTFGHRIKPRAIVSILTLILAIALIYRQHYAQAMANL